MIYPKTLLKMKLLWWHKVLELTNCSPYCWVHLMFKRALRTGCSTLQRTTPYSWAHFVAMLSIFCPVSGHSLVTGGQDTPTPSRPEREGSVYLMIMTLPFLDVEGFMKRGIPCAHIILITKSGILWRRYASSDTSLDWSQKKSSHLSINVFSDFGASFAILGIGCVF